MTEDYLTIDYLKDGNQIQKKVYKTVTKNKIFEKLSKYNPIIVGTFPLGINIECSDIDIIGQTNDFTKSVDDLIEKFAEYHDFKIQLTEIDNSNHILCSFRIKKFRIEIFIEDKAPIEQLAYKHMLIEAKILKSKGDDFKQEVIQLKNKGLKTEEAFALLLGLDGDPYQMLLDFELEV